MKLNWFFAQANSNTFGIKPIHQLILHHIHSDQIWIDPFVNNSCFKTYCKFTNDLNPNIVANYHLNAIDFLKLFQPNSIDGVLFDPPYSVHQTAECYESFGLKHEENTTRADFYSELKDQVAKILRSNGICICCGWNSNGMGKKRQFKPLELLIVRHGGIHNDTLVIVEQKYPQLTDFTEQPDSTASSK